MKEYVLLVALSRETCECLNGFLPACSADFSDRTASRQTEAQTQVVRGEPRKRRKI
jgi:hypothetical protein